MKLIKKWFKYIQSLLIDVGPTDTQKEDILDDTVIEESTFTIKGDFTKADMFEQIWIEENVSGNLGASKRLRDPDYIDYHIWEDLNCAEMYKKHLPNSMVFRGSNPNIIFHGGCLGCLSQRLHGIDRCKGCKYFKAHWNLPELRIEGEKCATIGGEDLENFLKS